MEKKESYIVINGVRYDAVRVEDDAFATCKGCAFCEGDDICTMPSLDGYFIECDEDNIFVSRVEVATQQQLTERSEGEQN